MDLIEVDQRRRVTLPKTAHHDRYAVSTSPDGTITLTPVIVRSVLEEALRQRPGYIEKLERDAADPSNAIHFADWENPTA